MLGKRSQPAVGKLGLALRSGVMDSMTSPRSPLECKMQSPRGLKNYDQGGIGLGIVVAQDKSTIGLTRGEVLAKYAICGQVSSPSSPIPVTPSAKHDNNGFNKNNNCGTFKGQVLLEMEMMEGLDEEFTYVTCHGPNKSVTTRVYYDGGDFCKINQNLGVRTISPGKLTDDRSILASDSGSGFGSDFLSSCHLCRKTLHGRDIYMYRGEKAFCSAECRQKQIGMDERKEQCRSEVSRSGTGAGIGAVTGTSDISSSPCTYTTRGGIFFSTGIVAA